MPLTETEFLSLLNDGRETTDVEFKPSGPRSSPLGFAWVGAHRERWQRLRARFDERARTGRDIAWHDIDQANHMAAQDDHAHMLLSVPDEMVAEQRLKHEYPELFPARANYYVEMRRGRATEIFAGRADVLWPFAVFYELLRIELFIPLLDEMPELRQELDRLATETSASLQACASAELYRFLMDLKPRLLDLSHDKPLAEPKSRAGESGESLPGFFRGFAFFNRPRASTLGRKSAGGRRRFLAFAPFWGAAFALGAC
jgi:hypothetical protein